MKYIQIYCANLCFEDGSKEETENGYKNTHTHIHNK